MLATKKNETATPESGKETIRRPASGDRFPNSAEYGTSIAKAAGRLWAYLCRIFIHPE
jgi:hypothetical protein